MGKLPSTSKSGQLLLPLSTGPSYPVNPKGHVIYPAYTYTYLPTFHPSVGCQQPAQAQNIAIAGHQLFKNVPAGRVSPSAHPSDRFSCWVLTPWSCTCTFTGTGCLTADSDT